MKKKAKRTTYPATQTPAVGDYCYVSGPDVPQAGVARVRLKDGDSYLVEFQRPHPRMHDGHCREAKCRDHCGWWVRVEDIEPLPIELQIFRDGDETYCLRGDQARISGHATRTGDDGYDPLIGAMIAMARAYGRHPTEVAYKLLRLFSVVPEEDQEETGKPAAKWRIMSKWNGFFGEVGKPTKFKDRDGVPLCVGDKVSVVGPSGYEPGSLNWVVETKEDGAFIMGICAACDPRTGTISQGWEVTWVESYKELRPGDEGHHGVLRVEEPPEVKTEVKPKRQKKKVLSSWFDDLYGVLGDSSTLMDARGTKLFVGDVVDILGPSGYLGQAPVVFNRTFGPSVSDYYYVMGLGLQDFSKDKQPQDYVIKKARSYEDLKLGEKFTDGFLTVKEDFVNE